MEFTESDGLKTFSVMKKLYYFSCASYVKKILFEGMIAPTVTNGVETGGKRKKERHKFHVLFRY